MNIHTVRLEDLVEDPRNPRTHDETNLAAIRSSLREHGQVEPIVVQKSSHMIIAGNGRASAMRALGWETANAVVLDVDDTEARALSIKLNRTAELAGWDEDVLAAHFAELSELSRFDVSDFGFDDDDLASLLDSYASSADELDVPTDEGTSTAEASSADSTSKDDSTSSTLDEHTQPTDMRASKQREIRLYLSPDDEQTLQLRVRALAQSYERDNVTDTIVEAVAREFARLDE